MSRHGKSHGGKSHSDKPRKIAEPKPQRPIVAAEATGAPKVAAEATGAAKREDLVRQAPAPPPVLAKTLVAAAEPDGRPPRALESAVATMERSLQAASRGTVEVNRMLLDIGRQNVASGLDLARSLAAAKTPIEAARLHLAFWDERMKALLHQAEELRALSADLVAKANEPIREHMRRSLGPRAG
jgi:hypothetical protein